MSSDRDRSITAAARLREAAKAEKRLLRDEALAEKRLQVTRARLGKAEAKLKVAQERVVRRAQDVADAESDLRARQNERSVGPNGAEPHDEPLTVEAVVLDVPLLESGSSVDGAPPEPGKADEQ